MTPTGTRWPPTLRTSSLFLTLALGGITACGGGTSRSSFVTDADDVCRDANAPVASLSAPSDFDDLADGSGKLAAAGDTQLPRLRDLDRPGGDEDETDAIFASIAGVSGAAATLKDAADRRDEKGTALAAVDLTAKARQAGDGARAYGFATCGVSTQAAADTLVDGAKAILKVSFVAKAGGICDAAGEVLEDVEANSPSQALRAFTTLSSTYTRLKTEIAAIAVPPGDQSAVDGYLDAVQELIDKINEFKDNLSRGNDRVLEALLKDLDSLVTQANAKADAYGIEGCGTLSDV